MLLWEQLPWLIPGHPREVARDSWSSQTLREAQQQSPAWHQPLSPHTQTRLPPFARGPPQLRMEHTPRLGSWNRVSTALAPCWGWGAVFTNMLRAVPASSLVSLFRAWTHREAKAQLKTPFKPQPHLTAPANSYMEYLRHARH